MHLGEAATENDGELIADLFGAVGKVWKMDEKLSDAAAAVGYVHVFAIIRDKHNHSCKLG